MCVFCSYGNLIEITEKIGEIDKKTDYIARFGNNLSINEISNLKSFGDFRKVLLKEGFSEINTEKTISLLAELH